MPTYDLRDDAPRYVAEALKALGHNWVDRDELSDPYDPPRPNNMAEMTAEFQKLSDYRIGEADAKAELIFEAIESIRRNNRDTIEWEDEDFQRCRLAEGVDPDQLFDLNNRPLIRGPVLPDLFTPQTGLWADNIRSYSPEGLKELRESMQAYGWQRHLPAIADENGVVIVGHRRLDVAKELGIEPVIARVRFGEGDKGEAARAALAIASNVGAEKISGADRKKIAADLYGSGRFSMAEIGKLLKVATMTVSRDLSDLTSVKSPDKPKRGRPRKQPKSVEPVTKPAEDTLAEELITAEPDPTPEPTPVPGGLTEDTSGQTDRVAAALERARAAESTPAPRDDHEDLDLVARDDEEDEVVVRVGIMIGQLGRAIDKLADVISTLDPAAKRRVLEEHHTELENLNNEKLRRVFNEVQGKRTRKRAAKRTPAANPAPAADTTAQDVLGDIAQGLSGLFQTQDAAS